MYIYVCTYRRPTAGVSFRLSRSDASEHRESIFSFSLSLPFLIHTLTLSLSDSLSLAHSTALSLSHFVSIACSACESVCLLERVSLWRCVYVVRKCVCVCVYFFT